MFQEEVDSIMIPLLSFFVQHSPVNTIHFVGHGRAGALATLAGFRVARLYPDDDIHVITTGSPRIGDESFRKLYENATNISIDRIVIKEDVVPYFPRFRGYTHIGNKWRLHSKESRWYNNPFSFSTYITLLERQYLVPHSGPQVQRTISKQVSL
jgi:predicted lipase